MKNAIRPQVLTAIVALWVITIVSGIGMLAMPERRLISGHLCKDGEVCALGVGSFLADIKAGATK